MSDSNLPIIGQKENEEKENRVYTIEGALSYNLAFSKKDGQIAWDMKYETSLQSQVAVFSYVVDMLKKIIDNRKADNEAWLKKHPSAKAKMPYTHTSINKYISMRNEMLWLIDEMLPFVFKQAQESVVEGITVVSDLSSIKKQ